MNYQTLSLLSSTAVLLATIGLLALVAWFMFRRENEDIETSPSEKKQLEAIIKSLTSTVTDLEESLKLTEEKWKFTHQKYVEERDKRFIYQRDKELYDRWQEQLKSIIIPRKSGQSYEQFSKQFEEHYKNCKLIEVRTNFEESLNKLKTVHPEPQGIVPELPEGAIIPDNGYQLGLEDILNKETDFYFSAVSEQWEKVSGVDGYVLKQTRSKIAYRIYKPEHPEHSGKSMQIYQQPLTPEEVVAPDHPTPKGEVPELPEEVIIPDNGYQLGLEDVLQEKTDFMYVPLLNQFTKVEESVGLKVNKLVCKIVYRIYK